MKKGFIFVLILSVTTVFGGCGSPKKDTDTTIRKGRGATPANKTGQNPGPNGSAPSAEWGDLNLGTQTEISYSFNNNVGKINVNNNDKYRYFLSTHFNFNEVGASTMENDGALRVNYPCRANPVNPNDKVDLRNQVCTSKVNFELHLPVQSNNQEMTLAQAVASNARIQIVSGYVNIVVWDSLTGQTLTDGGKPLTPIPVYVEIDPTLSYVQGATVSLVFRDNYGKITLTNGAIQNEYLTGTLMFENSAQYQPNFTAEQTSQYYSQDPGKYKVSGVLATLQNMNKCAAFKSCQ